MTAGLSAEVLDLGAATNLRDAWNDLVGRCLEPSVFTEPDFLLAAARHLAPPPGPAFIIVRDSAGQLVGLCPVLRRWRPPGMAARQWTHPQATEALPLLDREQAPKALETLLGAVSRLPGRPAAMIWSALPETGATAALLGTSSFAQVRLDQRTRAILAKGVDANNLPAKARKELRRQANRLSDQGPLLFRSANDPAAVTVALDHYLALEGQGWKGRRGSALGNRRDTRAFVGDALRALAAQGRCRIDSLELGGRPAAMGVILRGGNRGFFWKTAYDETLARFSPGVQLALRITERQLDEDVAWTDSCAIPGHSMIDRVWAGRINVADYLVATKIGSPTPALRLVCTIERQRRWMRAKAKSLALPASRLTSRNTPRGQPAKPTLK